MSAEDDHALTLDNLKILAIFMVLLAGFVGASCPVLFAYFFREKESQRNVQTVIKVLTCMSVGIVLATAMIHMLPEGLINLKEGGEPIFADPEEAHNESAVNASAHEEEEHHDGHSHPYPFGFLFAMVGIAIVYIISTEINWYGTKKLKELEGIDCDEEEEERQAAMIKLYLLEVGIAVHSIIIGITLGISASYSGATTLFIVLCIHQFFEGLAIGSLSVQAQVTFSQAACFVATFALTTPVGIGIGLGIHKHGAANQTVQGVLETLSAGILLHMALVEMLPHIFGTHSHHAHGPLPLAKLHDHVHGHDDCGHHHGHGHGHSHGEEVVPAAGDIIADPTKKTEIPAEVGNPSAVAEEEQESATTSNPLSTSAAEATVVANPSRPGSNASTNNAPSGGDGKTKALTKYTDDHAEDESAGMRILCYFAFLVGCTIQSVLGIWA